MKEYAIRTATKAIIINKDKILLNKYKKGSIYYTLPGGGQHHNEDLKSNLRRECLEEIGAEVEVGDVLFVREFIADHHNPSPNRAGYHQVNIIFECQIKDTPWISPQEQDNNQTGIEWIKIEDLLQTNLYPLSLRPEIVKFVQGRKSNIYLGETD